MSEHKRHIVVISQYYFPENFRITDICESLVAEGFDVTVITGIPNYPEGRFYKGYGCFKKKKEMINGVNVIRIPIIPRGKSSLQLIANYYSFVISGWFFKLFTRLKGEVVYIHEVSPMMQTYVGVWLAQKWKVKSIVCIQDLWPESMQSTSNIQNKHVIHYFRKQTKKLYDLVSKILVSSKGYIDSIQSLNVPKGKISYWPQYAESFYRPNASPSALIPNDGILNITFAGNIGVSQGLEILLFSAKLLQNKGELVRFNIVGDGRNKDSLIELIQAQGVSNYFNFIDRQPPTSIPGILSASDAAFLSFSTQPLFKLVLPAKLQSYLACGIPIIASVAGESANVLNDSGAGLVAELGDAEALTNCILDFKAMSVSARQQMANNGLAYSQRHFERTNLIQQLIRELSQV